MQAILTKYIPATNTKPSRIKATAERGSLTRSWQYDGRAEDEHRAAAAALCQMFADEDAKALGEGSRAYNTWARPFVTGCLPDGSYAHVFID